MHSNCQLDATESKLDLCSHFSSPIQAEMLKMTYARIVMQAGSLKLFFSAMISVVLICWLTITN